MALHGNFAIVRFDQLLGPKDTGIADPDIPFVGNQTSEREFWIDGMPAGEGYVLIQAADVGSYGHRILINGVDLPHHDLNPESARQTWRLSMDIIPDGILAQEANTIQIVRDSSTEDDFVVGSATIHWREVV
jgi:hypothetical protein